MGCFDQGNTIALAHQSGPQDTVIPSHLACTLYTVERFWPLESNVQRVTRTAWFADLQQNVLANTETVANADVGLGHIGGTEVLPERAHLKEFRLWRIPFASSWIMVWVVLMDRAINATMVMADMLIIVESSLANKDRVFASRFEDLRLFLAKGAYSTGSDLQ